MVRATLAASGPVARLRHPDPRDAPGMGGMGDMDY
jgi:hypothetical protein